MIDATQQIQVDITYHYPPELLELLCDAVPVLVPLEARRH